MSWSAAATVRALAVGAGLLLGPGLPVGAESRQASPQVDPDAERILRSMSSYLARQKIIVADYDVDNEVIDETGQKLQFSSSGSLAMQRPNKLHATRHGGSADAELYFDGKTATLLGKGSNVYAQLSAPGSIDELIEMLRSQVEVDLAGADLLYASPLEGLMADVDRGSYLGTDVVDGVSCDHLAFRSKKVDWQLWVQRSEKPLPLKYVITSKWVTGAPEYVLRLRDWKLPSKLEGRRFEFKAPAGAKRVEMIATNEIGELSEGAKP